MIKPGDIGVVRGKSPISAAIRFFTRRGALGAYIGPMILTTMLWYGLFFWAAPVLIWIFFSWMVLGEPTWASHIRLYVTGGETPAHCEIVEANLCGLQWKKLPYIENEQVYRANNLSDADTAAIAKEALRWIGLPYGFGALALFALDYLVGLGVWNVSFFRKMVSLRRAPVCSSAAVVLYAHTEAAGKDFGVKDPRLASPGVIHDFVRYAGHHYKVYPPSLVDLYGHGSETVTK